jgi:hypothetical protein
MYPTSPSHDTTTLGKPLKSEDELDKRRKHDDYRREKKFKDFILWVAMLFVGFIVSAFIFDYVTNPKTREFVMGLIRQNAVGIIFFVISMIGISIQKNKE